MLTGWLGSAPEVAHQVGVARFSEASARPMRPGEVFGTGDAVLSVPRGTLMTPWRALSSMFHVEHVQADRRSDRGTSAQPSNA